MVIAKSSDWREEHLSEMNRGELEGHGVVCVAAYVEPLASK